MKKIFVTLGLIFLFVLNADAQLIQSNYTGVLIPKYIASGGSTRLPYIFRATVTGLQANSFYRYYSNACRYTDFGGNNSGAGNPIYINGSNFRYSTSTSLSTAGGYDSLLTDASGNYTGWFGFVHTGNARFTPGNYVYPSITLDSVGNGTTKYRFALNDSIFVLQFADSANLNSGTGLYGISFATPKNVVSLYDNVSGSGRPLSVAYVESAGIDTTTMTSLVRYYTDSVAMRNGRYGTVIPNLLSTGVRRINVHRLSDGSVASFQADADGIWPSGVNTVNPNGGSVNPLRLTQQDAPLLVKSNNIVPEQFELQQNFPNPFNPSTVINFSLSNPGFTELKVYDELGRVVGILVSEYISSGNYKVRFDASRFGSGVYFYTLTSGNFRETKKMLLIK